EAAIDALRLRKEHGVARPLQLAFAVIAGDELRPDAPVAVEAFGIELKHRLRLPVLREVAEGRSGGRAALGRGGESSKEHRVLEVVEDRALLDETVHGYLLKTVYV